MDGKSFYAGKLDEKLCPHMIYHSANKSIYATINTIIKLQTYKNVF